MHVTPEAFSKSFEATVDKDGSFRFHAPVSIFEKAGAPEGQRRRIGGLITTETKDKQGETVLQRGLDFSPFLADGWINDNHGKGISDVVGEPDPTSLKFVRKGDRLPDGGLAPADGHWAEGWLYEDEPRADAIWKKALALRKSPGKRRLGFSIEGGIIQRAGHDGKTLARAVVKHLAVTHVPVNTQTSLAVLAKALVSMGDFVDEKETNAERAAESGTFLGNDAYRAGRADADAPVDLARIQAASALGTTAEDAEKVTMDGVLDMDLAAGQPQYLPAYRTPFANSVSQAAADAASDPTKKALTAASPSGRALAPQSLEHDARPLTKSEAIGHVLARYPNISLATAGRVVDTIVALKRGGILGDLHGR